MEYGKLALEAVGNVILAATRHIHCCHVPAAAQCTCCAFEDVQMKLYSCSCLGLHLARDWRLLRYGCKWWKKTCMMLQLPSDIHTLN